MGPGQTRTEQVANGFILQTEPCAQSRSSPTFSARVPEALPGMYSETAKWVIHGGAGIYPQLAYARPTNRRSFAATRREAIYPTFYGSDANLSHRPVFGLGTEENAAVRLSPIQRSAALTLNYPGRIQRIGGRNRRHRSQPQDPGHLHRILSTRASAFTQLCGQCRLLWSDRERTDCSLAADRSWQASVTAWISTYPGDRIQNFPNNLTGRNLIPTRSTRALEAI
jgi:hypothetical protein